LAGLLFVSLSINREKITAQKNRIMLRAAQRSFGDLMFALFIALLFLIPAHETYSLGIPLFILAACRAWLLIRSFYRSTKDTRKDAAGRGSFREYMFQALSCLGLLAATIEIYRGAILATFFLVPVIALLLYSASLNAWLLLLMEKGTDDGPSTQPEAGPK
jgi:hypothetical protein